MEYCLHYNTDSALKEADEIEYPFRLVGLAMDQRAKKDSVTYVITFCLLEQKILNTEIIDILVENSKNFRYIKYRYKYREDYDFLCEVEKKHGIRIDKFYASPATNSIELISLAEMGVSDIIITGEIAFNMDRVEALKARYGFKVRMVPNLAQFKDFSYGTGLLGPWIRPDDLDVYEDVVDIIEFFESYNNREEIIYMVYAKDKHWHGNLNEIVQGLSADVDGINLPKAFTEKRKNCQHRCTQNDSCHYCEKYLYILNLTQELEEEGLNND